MIWFIKLSCVCGKYLEGEIEIMQDDIIIKVEPCPRCVEIIRQAIERFPNEKK